MKKSIIIVFLLFLSFTVKLFAQNYSTTRCVESYGKAKLIIDSVAAVPNSFIIYRYGVIVHDSLFRYSIPEKTLTISNLVVNDTLRICFRILPPAFNKSFFLFLPPKKEELISSQIYQYSSQHTSAISDINSVYSNLDKNGNVSRGISVGSNNDFSLTSGLNLQLNGRLSENLWISASLTDSNIPVQPDGTTAQINDFDKIFIQVYNDKMSTTLGDYFLQISDSHFTRVDRKQQGISFEVKPQTLKRTKLKYKSITSASVSKGNYHRYTITSIEGRQGPYRLQGANNEMYIVIIADSERVYIDGVLQQRGENNDYVMNYNSAEITFTQRKPIARESRIVVEFEYTDRNYVRFIAAHSEKWESEKTSFGIGFVSESDAKNQTIDLDLKDDWIDLLSSIGNNTGGAIVENVREEPFDHESIRYAKEDTTINGAQYTFYRYSNNPDSAKYAVGFSYVGHGAGDYIVQTGIVNGRFYQWQAPVNGEKQGNYAPIVQLVTPKSKQNVFINGEIRPTKNTKISSELVYSHYDLNTFSKIDNKTNHGFAFISKIAVGNDTSRLSTNAEYQFIQKQFESFERYRNTEFERDWNLPVSTELLNQHYMNMGLTWYERDIIKTKYLGEVFLKENVYRGLKNSLVLNLLTKKIKTDITASLVNTNSDTINTQFIVLNSDLGYEFNSFRIGIRTGAENNQQLISSLLSDQLAYRFYNISPYLQLLNIEKFKMTLSSGLRNDDKVYGHTWTALSTSKYVQAEGKLGINSNHNWGFIFNYKNIDVHNKDIWGEQIRSDQTVSGQITNQISLWKRIISISSFYEVGSGLESRKDYMYIKTVPGEGTHIWRDLNSNNIQELEEFETAAIQAEAEYIRIFIATNDYMSAYYCTYRQTLGVNFSQWKSSKNIVLKLLSKLSNQTNFQINNKKTDSNFWTYSNPFNSNADDTSILAYTQSYRNIVSFNKSNQRWGVDYTIIGNQNKTLLASGSETRGMFQQSILLRYNIFMWLSLYNDAILGESSYVSQTFGFKNYTIATTADEVKVVINSGVDLRFELKYKYSEKENDLNLNKAKVDDMSIGFQYAKLQKGSVNGSVSYIINNFKGDKSDATNYELLDGLQPGKNFTWQLGIIANIAKSFQLTLQYHGRKSPEIKTVHTGSVLVKVFF